MKVLSVNSLWFVCSITLNALGNSFMIIANLGSAPWASAGENLAYILPLSVGVCIIMLNLFSFVLSYLMKVKFTLGIIIKSIALAFVFGILIDLFLYIQHQVYVPGEIGVRLLYLFIGLNLIAIALSIYFQSGSIHLPADYLLKAFGKLMKNYTLGNIVCTAIPLTISLLIILYRHHVLGLGLGTFLFMIGIGLLIDQYNRWIVISNNSKKEMHSA
ncbi:hypothetical protein [Oceanobacillus senegalensis]|uniref:hypothetical protein n=1 Tax=Oceanobacillus senegalensis TaxID=1936063 RepID=UPI000A30B433|nr:hypothetical protein [Oceanobacillus senegalensis]